MRTKKALLNMVSSMGYQIVSIICGLILPRLILSAFGSTYNGVISSATQFLSMISVLNIGIAGATRVALYKSLAAEDKIATSRIMKATNNYMHKVGACVIVYAIILCIVYPFISHNDLSRIENSALIAIVSIATFAEYFFGLSNSTLIWADQRAYVISVVNIIAVIANTILSAVLILTNQSIFIVKLASSFVFLLAPVSLQIYVDKKYKLIKNCEPDNEAIKGRRAVAFHSVANIIHNNTDLLILTVFTDAKQISVYTVYYLAVGKIKSIMGAFTSGLEATFGNMWAKGEFETLKHRFGILEYALYSFTIVAFSCVGVLLVPFVRIYTLGVTDTNYILPVFGALIALAEGMYCVREPYLILVQATGNYEATKIGALIEAVLNICISLTLVNVIGINGVIVGTLIANVFRTIQFAFFASKEILKTNIRIFFARIAWLVVNVGIIVVFSLNVIGWLPVINGWFGWLVQAVIVFCIACTITIITSLIVYRNDFVYLVRILISAISRKA